MWKNGTAPGRSRLRVQVLARFAEAKSGGSMRAEWAAMAQGLVVYFDKCLPKILLYRQEREQYDKFARGRGPPSSLYGAEHLLRLLSKLPSLLSLTDLLPDEVKRLQQKIPELYKFLVKNRSDFFLSAYDLRENLLSKRLHPNLPPRAPPPGTAPPPPPPPPLLSAATAPPRQTKTRASTRAASADAAPQ